MFEIGNSLREARVRRGVDYAQAELATKIRGKYLRALEEEQFSLLPAQTYIKGFLRTYAEYLGLDGQLYVDEFNSRFVAGADRDPRVVPAPAGVNGQAPARMAPWVVLYNTLFYNMNTAIRPRNLTPSLRGKPFGTQLAHKGMLIEQPGEPT